jgi:hypothetical protein
MRRALLTLHIAASVALVGDSAGFLAVAVRAATDPGLASASYELLNMFSLVFGIPLSFIALLLILSVILVGAFAIGPTSSALRAGDGGGEWVLVAASAWDVLALSIAVGLSVYKPRLKVVR